MSEPQSPKQVVPTLGDLTPNESASAEETGEPRPAASGPNDVDLRTLLSPPQAPGELGRISHYRVLEILGCGGMGMVLLAEDLQLERRVALKIILPDYARIPLARERLLREAKAAAKIRHDNVVIIYQVAEERGIPFIAMELLKGVSLEAYLKKKGGLGAGQVVRLAREMADGLKAAHLADVVHRDIKPGNIWLESPKGRVKILDFGLAREQGRDLSITQAGALLGTPKYMSPEQADGRIVDARSDLFSLGAVLYRLCAGKDPFTGPTLMKVLDAVRFERQISIRQINADVPARLEQLIDRLLAKEPDQRPQTAVEVAAELGAISGALRSAQKAPIASEALDVPYALPVPAPPRPGANAKAPTKLDKPKGQRQRAPERKPPEKKAPEQRPSEQKTTAQPALWLGLAFGALMLLIAGILIFRNVFR
jgi:eukaryotic-like serine/threonine-protein kinase